MLRVLIKFTATNDGCKLIVKESNWNDSDSPQGLKKIAELITIMQPDQFFFTHFQLYFKKQNYLEERNPIGGLSERREMEEGEWGGGGVVTPEMRFKLSNDKNS